MDGAVDLYGQGPYDATWITGWLEYGDGEMVRWSGGKGSMSSPHQHLTVSSEREPNTTLKSRRTFVFFKKNYEFWLKFKLDLITRQLLFQMKFIYFLSHKKSAKTMSATNIHHAELFTILRLQHSAADIWEWNLTSISAQIAFEFVSLIACNFFVNKQFPFLDLLTW